MLHAKLDGSEALNWKVADEAVVVADGPEVIVVWGGVVSPVVGVNGAELDPVPPQLVVTEMGPAMAPGGTVACSSVSEFRVKLVVPAPGLLMGPWNATMLAPVKCKPTMSTLDPAAPLVGVKEVMVGAGGGGPTW